MRDGWEIRKLGDACILTMGQSPESSTYNEAGNGMPFFQGCADFGPLHPTITTFCSAPKKIAEVDDVLMSVRAPIGTLNVANVQCCIGRGLASIRQKQGITIHKYLYYFISKSKKRLQDLGTGATFKAIGKETLVSFPIPVPPIQEQEKIVAELDCLTGIIEKKKQQLEELDKLAQSIFYDMFGDPITNEKGWTTKTLKDICDRLYAGGDVPKERLSKTKSGAYSVPILSNGKGNSAIYGYTDIPRETSPAITISGRGTIGYSRIQIEPFFPIIRLIVAVPSPQINIVFLHSHISLMPFESTGGAIPQLTVPMVKNRGIICPPIDLQNEFAQKVEAIEKQKELVKRSIVETETLFNSRMDYWFN